MRNDLYASTVNYRSPHLTCPLCGGRMQHEERRRMDVWRCFRGCSTVQRAKVEPIP